MNPGAHPGFQNYGTAAPPPAFLMCWNNAYPAERGGQPLPVHVGRGSRDVIPKGIDRGNAREAEIRQESVQFRLHPAEAGIGSQPRNPSYGQARLRRVQFPRMEVHAGGLAIPGIQSADARGSVAVRQQPQIPASPYRQLAAENPDSRDGYLDKAAGRHGEQPRAWAEFGHPVPVVRDGIDAGIVGKAAAGEKIQAPIATGPLSNSSAPCKSVGAVRRHP